MGTNIRFLFEMNKNAVSLASLMLHFFSNNKVAICIIFSFCISLKINCK